jgi:hypothetical protein
MTEKEEKQEFGSELNGKIKTIKKRQAIRVRQVSLYHPAYGTIWVYQYILSSLSFQRRIKLRTGIN